jgi:hypothetical protein
MNDHMDIWEFPLGRETLEFQANPHDTLKVPYLGLNVRELVFGGRGKVSTVALKL